MSGGSDFEPEQRQVAEAETVTETPAVTRAAASPTLISLNLPTRDVVAEPAVESEVIADIVTEPVAEVVAASAQTITPPLDLRTVSATRVNMRVGPGTNFGVVDAFNRGTTAEVMLVNGDGWAQVRSVDTGQTGWMAERLLTDG